MHRLLILLLLALTTQYALPAYADGDCTSSCGSSAGQISVDIAAHCMCVDAKENKCFKIDTGGAAHPTYNGSGNLHDAEGAKYQTKKGVATADYDNDAIATGIAGNDHAGMWIHKAGDEGGNDTTLGCMGVPVDHWKDVKEAYNNKEVTKVTVCGSAKTQPSFMRQRNSSETNQDFSKPPPKATTK